MAVRQLRYGDDEILRKKCKPVPVVDNRIRMILDDMMDTLHATENGAAIAANQVGILKRLVVIDYCGQRLRLVNPVIIEQKGRQHCEEGCLSFPGRYVRTVRPQKVTIQAQNEEGRLVTLAGEGEMAKCFCHELEHLDGIIFLDHALKNF